MRLGVLSLFLVSLLGVISCEEEAGASEFVPQDLFEEAVGLDGLGGDEEIIESIPTRDNPLFIGDFNGSEFNAVTYEGTLTDTDDPDNKLLSLFFEDADGSQLTITINNPETAVYAFEEGEIPIFEVEFFDAISDVFFTVRSRPDAMSNSGTISLDFRENSGEIIISAQFVFNAASDESLGEGIILEFRQGAFENLPVN